MLDIHALQVFMMAARAGSFTAAARNLNMSQPAVSMQIRNLQAYLGVDLFAREGRTMNLTPAGEAMLPLAERILSLTNEAEDMVRGMSSEVCGRLRLGCSAHSADYVLPLLIERFQRSYPDVGFSIEVMSLAEVQQSLLDGVVDFGFTATAGPCEGIVCRTLFRDMIVLVVPAGHPWQGLDSIMPHQLVEAQFICQNRESACRETVSRALERFGIDVSQFNVRMEMGSPEAIVSAVEHGLGVSFVPLLSVAPRVPLGKLAIVDVEGIQLSTSVNMGYSDEHSMTLAQSRFKLFIEHPQTQSILSLMSEGRVG